MLPNKIYMLTLLYSLIENDIDLKRINGEYTTPHNRSLTLDFIMMRFNAFANKSDTDQAGLIESSRFAYKDTIQEDLTSDFFVLYTNMSV